MFRRNSLHGRTVLLFFVLSSIATVGAAQGVSGQESAAAAGNLANDQSSLVLWAATIVLTLIALSIVWSLFKGDLSGQVASFLFEGGTAEQGGKPSASRLQMVIWNFMIAFSFIYLLAKDGNATFVNDLFSNPVLWLLGISNGTYLLGKMAGGGSTSQPSSTTNSTVTASGTPDRGGQPLAEGEGPGPEGKH